MKTLPLLLAFVFYFITGETLAQHPGDQNVRLYNLDGELVNSSDILGSESPTILVFWKSNEKKCCLQIGLMIDAKEKLTETTDVKIVAICVDSEGMHSRIKPMVYGKDWEIDVYIDINSDLKRAMNIPTTPFTVVFDENQQLICEYNGYCAGADDLVCDKIKDCLLNNNPPPELTINY